MCQQNKSKSVAIIEKNVENNPAFATSPSLEVVMKRSVLLAFVSPLMSARVNSLMKNSIAMNPTAPITIANPNNQGRVRMRSASNLTFREVKK
jgi:hypothetical protein